jgi:hypothetical protein
MVLELRHDMTAADAPIAVNLVQIAVRAVRQVRPDMTASEALTAVKLVRRS